MKATLPTALTMTLIGNHHAFDAAWFGRGETRRHSDPIVGSGVKEVLNSG